LNEFPQWYTVDENRLYRVGRRADESSARVWLGPELIAGIEMSAGDWIIESVDGPPYATVRTR